MNSARSVPVNLRPRSPGFSSFGTLRHAPLWLALMVLLLGGLLTAGVFLPLHRYQQTLASDYQSGQAELAEISRLAASYAQLKSDGEGRTVQMDITSSIATSLQQAGLQASRMQVNPDGSVQLRFDAVDFNQALGWLGQLEQLPGVLLATVDVVKGSAGLVSLNVSLQQNF